MKRAVIFAAMSVGLAVGFGAPVALADQTQFTDFEGFNVDVSINGQNGWGVANPAYDQKIVDFDGNTVWRVSNAVASGSFGDMPFAPRLGGLPADTVLNPTNHSPGAFAGESGTGTKLDVFKGKFSFRSATGAPQSGARITVSADSGQGGRQSFIAINDTGAGLEISTFDVDNAGNFIGPIIIASGLSYKKWHTTSVEIRFKDGADNDVVKYFVNGKRVHKGQSWEQFYTIVQSAVHPLGVPVQTLLFRISGDAVPAVLGGGYFIDNVTMSVSDTDKRRDGKDKDERDDGDGDDD